MHEAKTQLSKLVAAIERGDEDEVEIARNGQVVARLVRAKPPRPREPGIWAGRVTIHPDFVDDLPDDVAEAFRGEAG